MNEQLQELICSFSIALIVVGTKYLGLDLSDFQQFLANSGFLGILGYRGADRWIKRFTEKSIEKLEETVESSESESD